MHKELHFQEESTEVPIQLYQLIDEFNRSCAKDHHFSNIMYEGLSVFAQLRDTFFASVFLMNPNTFDFEHSSTLPRSRSTEAELVYQLLLEKGRVGSALSTGQIIAHHEETLDSPYYFLVPMVGTRGVMGLLLVSTTVSPSELSNAKLKCYTYFTQMFAKTLENAEYIELNTKLEDILQQRVASRTIRLVETQRELLDQMEELKFSLATAIPHEIRTPINTIIGSSAFLRDHYADVDFANATEMLADIYQSAQRLQRLFENYQMYSRLSITATRPDEMQRLRTQHSESIKLFIETIATYRSNLVQRRPDLKVQVEEAAIQMPEDLLRKVLDELVDNAFKYSEPGQSVCISGRVVGALYELSVYDQGRGIHPENINHIQAYAQFDRTMHEQQGMGLGLAIVQRIADIMDAKLSIQSATPQRGTIVTLLMQLASSEQSA